MDDSGARAAQGVARQREVQGHFGHRVRHHAEALPWSEHITGSERLVGEPEPMCEPVSMVVFVGDTDNLVGDLQLRERLGALWRLHAEAPRMA